MGKIWSHLSFQGRANRQRYWLTLLAALVATLVGTFLIYAIPVFGPVIGMSVWLAAAAAGVAVAARRLHDRGKSAWWLLPMYVPVVAISGLNSMMRIEDSEPNVVLSMFTLPFSIWILVELGCLGGTIGPNRFGDDPLVPSSAEVFY